MQCSCGNWWRCMQDLLRPGFSQPASISLLCEGARSVWNKWPCLTLIQVVQEGRSTEALLFLFLIHHTSRRIWWPSGQCHRKNGWYERVPRLEVDLHSWYVMCTFRKLWYWYWQDYNLEGTLTCVVSFFLYFTISDFPEDAKWLTEEEKEFVKARLYEDVGHSKRNESLTLRRVLDVFKDCKCGWFNAIWLAYSTSRRQDHYRRLHVFRTYRPCVWIRYDAPLMITMIDWVSACIDSAYFAPSIIQGLGHSTIGTQLYSVPPWVCSFAFAMIIAISSDYFRHRFIFVLIPIAVALTGFIILLVEHHNTNVQYLACFLAAMGTYSALPIIVCWFNTNRECFAGPSRYMYSSLSSWRTRSTRGRHCMASRFW